MSEYATVTIGEGVVETRCPPSYPHGDELGIFGDYTVQREVIDGCYGYRGYFVADSQQWMILVQANPELPEPFDGGVYWTASLSPVSYVGNDYDSWVYDEYQVGGYNPYDSFILDNISDCYLEEHHYVSLSIVPN
jgi:hypothetical protein